MKKYYHYIMRIIRMSFLSEIAYPKDFLWFICMMPIFFAAELFGIYFLFLAGNITTIAGFTFAEFMFVSSLAALMYQISGYTIIGSGVIASQINSGAVDKYIVKPLPFTLGFIYQRIRIKMLILILIRVLILILILISGHLSLSLEQSLQTVFVFSTSIILLHCLFISADSVSFWFHKLDINEYFYETIEPALHYPATIYPNTVHFFCTFIIPIFLLTNPVYFILRNEYGFFHVILILSILFLWILITVFLWTRGQKVYQSAN